MAESPATPFRKWLKTTFPELVLECTDEELQGILREGLRWINGRRWSLYYVTANYLRDGYFHP